MTDISAHLGNIVLRWMAGNTMPAAPATVYLALYDGDPKSIGVEITTDIAAARLAMSFAALALDSGNALDTNTTIDFGASGSATPRNLSHVAVFDAVTSGNMLWSTPVPGGPYTVNLGADVSFASGDITFACGS